MTSFLRVDTFLLLSVPLLYNLNRSNVVRSWNCPCFFWKVPEESFAIWYVLVGLIDNDIMMSVLDPAFSWMLPRMMHLQLHITAKWTQFPITAILHFHTIFREGDHYSDNRLFLFCVANVACDNPTRKKEHWTTIIACPMSIKNWRVENKRAPRTSTLNNFTKLFSRCWYYIFDKSEIIFVVYSNHQILLRMCPNCCFIFISYMIQARLVNNFLAQVIPKLRERYNLS